MEVALAEYNNEVKVFPTEDGFGVLGKVKPI
jgi:hypothetical protein